MEGTTEFPRKSVMLTPYTTPSAIKTSRLTWHHSTTGCPICSWNWVGLTLICVFHNLVQPPLPNSHQLKQNWADSGTLKIRLPNQLSLQADETPCIPRIISSSIKRRARATISSQSPLLHCLIGRRRSRVSTACNIQGD